MLHRPTDVSCGHQKGAEVAPKRLRIIRDSPIAFGDEMSVEELRLAEFSLSCLNHILRISLAQSGTRQSSDHHHDPLHVVSFIAPSFLSMAASETFRTQNIRPTHKSRSLAAVCEVLAVGHLLFRRDPLKRRGRFLEKGQRRNVGCEFKNETDGRAGAILQEQFKVPQNFVRVCGAKVEFLLFRKGQELGNQLQPSIDALLCSLNTGTDLLWRFCALFSQSQAGFDYRQDIPEVVSEPAFAARVPSCFPSILSPRL
jgi:hypothetical protein